MADLARAVSTCSAKRTTVVRLQNTVSFVFDLYEPELGHQQPFTVAK